MAVPLRGTRLIGPNGAGKTKMLQRDQRLHPTHKRIGHPGGERDITGLEPIDVVPPREMARTFQAV